MNWATTQMGEVLRDLRLSESQKLQIYLGGVRAPDSDAMKETQQRIVETLKKTQEVREVVYLFSDEEARSFNPIVFEIHLPISLQAIGRQAISEREIEDFIVVYDGEFVMIGAICLRSEHTSSVYDARDRVITILTPILPGLLEIVPCLTHESISVVGGPLTIQETQDRREIYLCVRDQTVGKCVEAVYSALSGGMHLFYDAADSARRANRTAWKIEAHQSDLLTACREFIETSWKSPFRRRAIIHRMRHSAIEILRNVTDYSSQVRRVRILQANIEMHTTHNALFQGFIERVSRWRYTEPTAVDIRSTMGTIEHVRSESETYSSFMSNLASALLGGVVGSIATIVASFLLGIK